MKDISFFSKDTYLYVPNIKKPKVILAVSNSSLAKESFKLYNPFSKKAKLFKRLALFVTSYFNPVLKLIFKLKKHKNSDFIIFLNQKLNKNFSSSIYNATLQDKVVIQLQENNKVFGYVKFPINDIGKNNISNEIKAIKILSKKGIIAIKMQNFEFNNIPFFLIPELEGDIKEIPENRVFEIIEPYKKELFFSLKEHKRVLEIKEFLIKNELKKELGILNATINNSKEKYFEVFEHGDFAPWNIVKINNSFSAFDFEYFVENGLEYLDIIKYYFQVGRLLKGKNKKDLYDFVAQKIKIIEIKEFINIFLLKEIMVAINQQKEYHFESEMLNFINEY